MQSRKQEHRERNVFLHNSYLLNTGATENRNHLNHPWRGGWRFALVSFIVTLLARVATVEEAEPQNQSIGHMLAGFNSAIPNLSGNLVTCSQECFVLIFSG